MRTFIKIQYALFFLLCLNFCYGQSTIQTVRIDFQNPDGFTRHLALGFVEDNSATDGVDYGYDAPYINDLQNDLNWMIDENRYVIQGVGAFNTNKYYPLGMFLTTSGEVSISLNNLENFTNDVDVYLYDLELNNYIKLNDSSLTSDMPSGEYVNRFFITFSNSVHLEISSNYLLSLNDDIKNEISIRYSKSQNLIYVSGLPNIVNGTITLYNILGKKVREIKITKDKNQISTTGISEGIYLVRIETSTFKHLTKVYITN